MQKQQPHQECECTRRLANRKTPTSSTVKNLSGDLLTDPSEQLKRWFEHFQQILELAPKLTGHTFEDTGTVTGIRSINKINSHCPDSKEIEVAVETMKINKAPGIDGITAEMLKADATTSANMLQPLFKAIWETEEYPSDWLQGIIIKIPKKGSPTDCNNWRGIMLLSSTLKVFCKILLNRIQDKVEKTLRKEQAGFRAAHSCIDHIVSLRIIIEQINEMQQPFFMTFVDFEKAFDYVKHESIFNALDRKGIPEKLRNLIKAQYSNFKCKVMHEGMHSDPIEVVAGVRQGCILSPLLFLIVIDEVLHTAIDKNPRRGIVWNPLTIEHLNDLDYADDIVLFSSKQSHLQSKLDDLRDHSLRCGLKINIKKTKSIHINATQRNNITIAGQQIEEVEEFTYLGSQITADGGAFADITARLNKAKSTFAMLKKVWYSKQLTEKTKIRIFNSNIKSVLLYGCESWPTSVEIVFKLQTFINRCLRTIIRSWWPENWIANAELHRRCNQVTIDVEIRKRKWAWIGHTLRKPAQEIPTMALEWNPQGYRRRGRPRGSWRRCLHDEITRSDLTWTQLRKNASDRNKWKSLTLALCAT